MQKIASHNNITILIDGKPYMFIGNADSSGVLYEFLSTCDDEARIKEAINNVSVQNYIKTYGEYPGDVDIFDHGHEVSYIALDENYKAISEKDSDKRITVLNISNILDIAVPLSVKNKESATKVFKDTGQDAAYLAVFCSKCLWLHSVENLNNGNISNFKRKQSNMSTLNPVQMERALSDAFDDAQNVIIEGAHGVGKTEIIRSVFSKKLKDDEWLHFSCSSIDPFIDFMGCPIKSEENGIEFLKMIKPEKFAKGNIKAIFLDEFNRAPRNVKNAVMELLQFKTMNGDKIGDISVIWTAINPPDGDYDVDIIEPAQMDRFHLHLKIDGRPNKKYFVDKFGKAKGNGAITWWNKLDAKQKNMISPRRLDYIIDHINKGRNPEYCCMYDLPFADLQNCITQIPIKEKLDELKTDDEKFEFFKDNNNRISAKSYVMSGDNFKDWAYYFPAEHVVSMLTEATDDQVTDIQTKLFMEASACKEGSANYKPIHHFHNAVKPALQSKQNKEIVKRLEGWELVYQNLGSL